MLNLIHKYINPFKVLKKINLENKNICNLSLSKNGKYLMISDDDNYITIYNVQTNEKIIEHKCEITSYDPNDERMINNLGMLNINQMLCQCQSQTEEVSLFGIGSYDWYNPILPWEDMINDCLRITSEYQKNIISKCGITFEQLCISTCGKYVLTGLKTGNMHLQDAKSKNILISYKGHKDCIVAMSLSDCGLQCVSGSEDGEIRLWKTHSGKCINILDKQSQNLSGLAITSGAQQVIACKLDGTVDLQNVNYNSKCEIISDSTNRCLTIDLKGDTLVLDNFNEIIIASLQI